MEVIQARQSVDVERSRTPEDDAVAAVCYCRRQRDLYQVAGPEPRPRLSSPVRIAERPRCDVERLPHTVRAAVITP